MNRSQVIQIRVSVEEMATLSAAAEGINLARWAREGLLRIAQEAHPLQPVGLALQPPPSDVQPVHVAVERKPRINACQRCLRLGTPGCDDCRKAFPTGFPC